MNGSARVPRGMPTNALTRAVHDLSQAGVAVLDLTESNPTRVGLAYPSNLLACLADPQGLRYEPEPLGMLSAREAVAQDHARRGAHVEASDVVLSASTSEAYSWLFTLLCDAGDTVLVPRPSYPLFEHLARAACVRLQPYDIRFHGRWEVDLSAADEAPSTTRAVIVVSPNNPTGSYLRAAEVQAVTALCARRGWALIVDEVFADYAIAADAAVTDLAVGSPVLTFSLSGASKSLGLPQLKLAWTVVGGPQEDRRWALDGLEHLADMFLSVSTPVQLAAPSLLTRAVPVRSAILERVRANADAAQRIVAAFPACSLLPIEGGWTAVVRVPAVRTEEALVLQLLREERVLVHPGYYFDFDHEAFLVVSLLPAPSAFADGLARALRVATRTP